VTSPRFPAFLVALVLAVPAAAADRTVITVLETSDLHANLLPWDYARGVEGAWGLARVATRVRQIREESPHVLLLDGGDTIQGAPGGWLEARRPSGGPHFMAAAMGALAYDAMAVGNHEFNFGLEVLRRAQKDSSFPWLSANTRNASDGSAAFPEFLVKELGGVRVGVLGLTTPNVPGWEPEPNRPGLKWEDPVETAKRLVPLLRGEKGCDVVVVLFHSGLESDPVTGEPNGTAHENRVVALAREVPGIDLILTGHTHRKLSMTRVHGVPVMQPGRWGEVLARVDFVVERRGGKATVVETRGALLPSDASVAVDPQIAAIAKGPHERALSYLNEPLAIAPARFPEGERASRTRRSSTWSTIPSSPPRVRTSRSPHSFPSASRVGRRGRSRGGRSTPSTRTKTSSSWSRSTGRGSGASSRKRPASTTGPSGATAGSSSRPCRA
jgi:2',3'-cyclic-nucleotide 2'-phosphodiesterase/3'-nucleotidase